MMSRSAPIGFLTPLVLAHEVGHVVYRHGLRQVLQ